MPHPDEGLIHAWLDGELDAAEAARVDALVANDPEWAAAAAEARGLIAASARIIGTLDRVPANVIPKPAATPRRSGHPWMWRAAAAVVLMAGSAVVLERSGPNDLPVPKPAKAPLTEQHVAENQALQPVAPPKPAAKGAEKAVSRARAATSQEPSNAPVVASSGGENKIALSKKELDAPKQTDALRDKDVVAGLRLEARRADAAPAAASPPVQNQVVVTERAAGAAGAARAAPTPAVATQGALSLQKTTRIPASCWQQLQPVDSAGRIIRLEAGALQDSIQKERLTQHGDTLAAVNGRLTALRVPCPAP